MLIHQELTEAYGLVNNVIMPDYARTMFNGMLTHATAGYTAGAVGDTYLSISAGDVSDKTLQLIVNNRSTFTTNGTVNHITAFRNTVNPTADHWASFDFKWTDGSGQAQTKPFAIFGFNDAWSTGQWASHAVAPVVTLTKDGKVHAGGNVSASPVVLSGTLYHIDIEVLAATKQVNVYVNNVLAVSSPTNLSWLSGGLTSLGMRCDPWPVSADAQEQAMILSCFYDNVIFYDSTGTDFNSRVAQPILFKRLPLASQIDANFVNTGGAASTMAALSDYAASSGNFNTATYAKSPSANGLADTFLVNTSSISGTSTIKSILMVNQVKRNALGTRHIEARYADGAHTLDINYNPNPSVIDDGSPPISLSTDPSGNPWTLANLAAVKFGYVVKP